MVERIRDFFSPEAGQRRRSWLNEVEGKAADAMRYYLGPDLFPPVNALANGVAMVSPGADVQDAYTASGELMQPDRSLLDRAASGAALAGSLGAMFMPGGVSSIRQGIDDLADAGVRAARSPMLGSNAGNLGARSGRDYPTAPRDEWYGDANYEATGGRIETMTPQEFLDQVRPLELDDVAEDNIADLMNHIQSGRTLDPLQISAKGREDGRHRAYAAMRLGIDRVPVLRWGADTPAQQIARLLREGRAEEVTDDMMGALSPNDSMELMRLYEVGATGADMPMDTASRMARAEGMGFDTPSYHGTDANISAVDNDRLIGGQFWSTDDVGAINRGEVGAAGRGLVLPLQIKQQNPAGWRQYDQFGVDEMIGRGYDGLRLPESDGTNAFVTFDPEQVRSRFARFDPRLAHLSNLNAGVAGAAALGAGALAMQPGQAEAQPAAVGNLLFQQEQAKRIRDYLGGVQ